MDFEPSPSRVRHRSELFGAVPKAGGLDSGTLDRLRRLAGPPPKRLSRNEPLEYGEATPAQHGLVEVEAGVSAEDELGQIIGSTADPLHRLLALQMRQLSREHGDQFAMGLLARGLMMVQQMSLDQGRCQFTWLLSGMPEPNLQIISMRKKRLGLTPYAKLAAPSWVAGNIAYVKDMDYLESRLKGQKVPNHPDKALEAEEGK